MGFAVMHLNKSSASSSGSLGNHIDRKFVPKNADESRQHLNRFYDPKTKKFSEIKPGTILNKRIKERIEEGYTAPRKIRSNAVKSINFIFTGTHEDMKRIFSDVKSKKRWLQKNIQFLKEEFGGTDNIVSFAVHEDERTPHVHATIVPITEDGRLSAREYVNGRKRLKQLQDIYAKKMEEFGLRRGLEDGKVKHMTTAEYYKQLNKVVKIGTNITVEQKVNIADKVIAEHQKRLLDAKKTPKFDKKYRKKM